MEFISAEPKWNFRSENFQVLLLKRLKKFPVKSSEKKLFLQFNPRSEKFNEKSFIFLVNYWYKIRFKNY